MEIILEFECGVDQIIQCLSHPNQIIFDHPILGRIEILLIDLSSERLLKRLREVLDHGIVRHRLG